jgi:hypothetical protein
VPDFIVSADLGQAGDFTAVAVLKRSLELGPEGLPARDHRRMPVYRHTVSHLARYPLGTGYPAVVASVSEMVRRPELQPKPRLVIDATGVGRAVVDLFLNQLKGGLDVHPLTITGGDAARRGGWAPGVVGYWVPKVELVGSVQAALGTGRLKVAKGLQEGDTLRRELLDFRVRVTASAHETFGARQGAHDDLVLAVAMGVWLGERREIWYRTEAETDPDRRALTRERQAEEEAEQAAMRREREKREARRPWEMLLSVDPSLWTAI